MLHKFGIAVFHNALKPMMSGIHRGSQRLFTGKYLLYTNTAITVTLSCTGDVVQQNYQIMKDKSKRWDKLRTARISSIGFLFGPFCHYWYMYLDKWLPGNTMRIVFKKIVIDQLVCSPVALAMFLVGLNVLEQESWAQLKRDIVEKGTTLYAADWLVWPPAQLINFLFLPPRYRVLYDNTVAFGFDCYFSYVRYDKKYVLEECGKHGKCGEFIAEETPESLVDCIDSDKQQDSELCDDLDILVNHRDSGSKSKGCDDIFVFSAS